MSAVITIDREMDVAGVEMAIVKNKTPVHDKFHSASFCVLGKCDRIGVGLQSVAKEEGLQSYYLLTVSVGNIIVAVVSTSVFPKSVKLRQAYEFLFFSALMLLQ